MEQLIQQQLDSILNTDDLSQQSIWKTNTTTLPPPGLQKVNQPVQQNALNQANYFHIEQNDQPQQLSFLHLPNYGLQNQDISLSQYQQNQWFPQDNLQGRVVLDQFSFPAQQSYLQQSPQRNQNYSAIRPINNVTNMNYSQNQMSATQNIKQQFQAISPIQTLQNSQQQYLQQIESLQNQSNALLSMQGDPRSQQQNLMIQQQLSQFQRQFQEMQLNIQQLQAGYQYNNQLDPSKPIKKKNKKEKKKQQQKVFNQNQVIQNSSINPNNTQEPSLLKLNSAPFVPSKSLHKSNDSSSQCQSPANDKSNASLSTSDPNKVQNTLQSPFQESLLFEEEKSQNQVLSHSMQQSVQSSLSQIQVQTLAKPHFSMDSQSMGAKSSNGSTSEAGSHKARSKKNFFIGKNVKSAAKDSNYPFQGSLVQSVKTHPGSIQMQGFVKKAQINVIEMIIEELKEDFATLFTDEYGNYFCQKLILSASSEQRFKILNYFSKDFVKVACDDVGTHSMQRFVEIINRQEEKEIIFNSIKDNIVELAFHQQGNYVLLLLLGIFNGYMLDYIIEQLLDHVKKLALSSYGICILNKMIQLATQPEHIQKMVEVLSINITEIIQDPFGNYAITTALESWNNGTVCRPILQNIKEYFSQFAIQKYSSNVIEKCVERTEYSIIKEFFGILQKDNVMKSMIKHQQSFFVVQKIFYKLQSEEDIQVMKELIQKNLCYVNEKQVKIKCNALLKGPSPSQKSPYKYDNLNQ